ncbi:MAG: hypothetical protein H6Q60_1115 [Oscillospiraceae bacterium]|nr:hypothetical protein [Oscillospiraceae bacterium]
MKQNKFWILVLLALLGVTVFIILREQSYGDLILAVRRAHLLPLLLGVGLMFIFECCETACTYLILSALGNRTSFFRCLTYSFAGFYFSCITPASSGGQPAQIYCMQQDRVPIAHGTLDMLLIAIFYQGVTLLFALAALLLFPGLLSVFGLGSGLLLGVGAAILLLLTVAMLIFLWFPALAAKLSGAVLRLFARLRLVKDLSAARESLDLHLTQYHQGAALIRRRPELAPALFVIMAIQLSALYLVPFMVYTAFGFAGAGLLRFVATQALLSLAVYCVPLPGAAGVSEAVFLRVYAGLFGAAAVAPALLLSRGISCYGFLVLTGILTALIQMQKRRKKNAVPLPDCQ